MTLRDGHLELHQRLTQILPRIDWDNVSDRAEIALLLDQAAKALLRCPHRSCAYCYTVEKVKP